MPNASEHPDYGHEREHCSGVIALVNSALESTEGEKGRLDAKIADKLRHGEFEVSDDYIELKVGFFLQESAELRLRNLLAARSRPYFARIDYRDDKAADRESLYIGKMSLSRPK
ncbi:MAG: DNA helicase, partial [Oscillospiraceae bacterium]|nr:DNA helicase [Oscillospiraceae bacterium]